MSKRRACRRIALSDPTSAQHAFRAADILQEWEKLRRLPRLEGFADPSTSTNRKRGRTLASPAPFGLCRSCLPPRGFLQLHGHDRRHACWRIALSNLEAYEMQPRFRA